MGAVVVGYVAKPEGEAAVEQGIAEARLRNATLIVVNSQRGGREYDDDASVRSTQDLSALEARLKESGLDYDVRQLVRGFEPAEDLISIAESSSAELIVIGLRRRTPVGKLILGSNAQRILLDAPCPVLAVKVG
jgi:nucleotide-binding universal stress UspA family protein